MLRWVPVSSTLNRHPQAGRTWGCYAGIFAPVRGVTFTRLVSAKVRADLIDLVPVGVPHHFNSVSIRVPDKATELAVVHPGLPIKSDAYPIQVGQPGVPVLYLNGEVVGLVGFGLVPHRDVKLRVAQLQIPGVLLGPFRVEHLFVPLLAALDVGGGDVGVLDTADPDAALGRVGRDVRVTFCRKRYLAEAILPRPD